MSRSALAVAVALFAIGALGWWLAGDRAPPVTPAADAPAPPLPSPPPHTASAPPAAAAKPDTANTGTAKAKPRVTTRQELATALAARGLDAGRLIDGYRDWRLAHGYLEADPLAGITAAEAPAAFYRGMDRTTQKVMADAGDLGALQAYAASSLPRDPFTAIDAYGKASRMGSAAAMAHIAAIYGGNEVLRGNDPSRDPRQEAAAWALATIRQYGPAAATDRVIALAGYLTEEANPALTAVACARSLAIMADISASTSAAGQAQDETLPPVFVTEPGLYDRLPCRDTPAPVMPPRGLATCTAAPALGAGNRAVELWICGEN